MCGIAGVRKFGNTPITGEELVLLLCAIEHRGLHATGIALVTDGTVRVMKAAVPAWNFTKSDEFHDFLTENLTETTEIALLHTRWYTTGSPEDNRNNHPMFDGETAIVHNGMISNHHMLFNNGKYDRSCETDSDIIRAIISEHGMDHKGLRELNKMAGSAAIACVSSKYPGKLLLARSGSPLVFGWSDDGDKLYWASEAQAITKAVHPFHNVRGTWVQDTKAIISIGSMPDDTAWLFGPEEIEFHHRFSTCSYYRAPDYSKGRESYHTKSRNWKREMRNRTVPTHTYYQHSPYRGPAVETNTLRAATTKEEPKAEAKEGNTKNPHGQVHDHLKGAICKCPGCGAPVSNPKGLAWRTLLCPECNSSIGD